MRFSSEVARLKIVFFFLQKNPVEVHRGLQGAKIGYVNSGDRVQISLAVNDPLWYFHWLYIIKNRSTH